MWCHGSCEEHRTKISQEERVKKGDGNTVTVVCGGILTVLAGVLLPWLLI